MKKLLGITLALALVAPPGQASAEFLKNLNISGQLDIQNSSARNVLDFSTRPGAVLPGNPNNDRTSNSITRVLLNVDWDLLDDVHSQVTLRKNDRLWGGGGGAASGGQGFDLASQSAIGAPGGGTDVGSNVFVQRANITIDRLFGYFDTTVGRQYYGEPGDLIIYYGPKDAYGLFVTSIDAFQFSAETDMVAFSGMAGTTTRGSATMVNTAAMPENNTHVRGFDILWKNLPIKVHTFAWNRLTQGSGGLGIAPTAPAAAGATQNGLNDNLYVYGIKLRGEAAGGWFSLDFAHNSGQDRISAVANDLGADGVAGTGDDAGCVASQDACIAGSANYIGSAVMVDFGYNAEVANVGGFTPWANFGWGTGRSSHFEHSNEDFQSIASDYRPGIINRRFNTAGPIALGTLIAANGTIPMSTVGLTNRVVYGVGLNFTPAAMDQLTIGGQFWDYRFQRTTRTHANLTGALAMGNKHIGSEAGVTADWRHSENVNLGMGWAVFHPGGFIKESIGRAAPGVQEGNNPAQLWFADLTVRF